MKRPSLLLFTNNYFFFDIPRYNNRKTTYNQHILTIIGRKMKRNISTQVHP